MPEIQIEELRDQIDAIDEQIIKLLARRFGIARKVGEFKRKHNLQVEDRSREQAIVDRLAEHSSDPLTRQQITRIFTEIFSAAKEVQR